MTRNRDGNVMYHLSPKLLVSLLMLVCSSCNAHVKTGADLLIERRLELLKGKRVGLITNQTGRLSNGEFLLDALLARGVRVTALFSPEHGIRGQAQAGDLIRDETDSATGLPVYSLHGSTRKPESRMLSDVDVLVYDLQDVGARFYTYISTMGLAMEAAAGKGIPFVVLDRPNPLGGELVDGPVMHDAFRSFVGMYPLPVVYGLTCGELAEMINREGWLANSVQADLTVITMGGWTRTMSWEQTGLQWYPPSPNIPTPSTTVVYPATCYIEGTNLSEGRGTKRPFQQFGAPFIDAHALAGALDSLGLPGVKFSPTSFAPSSSKLAGELCQGVSVEIVDRKVYRPVAVGLHIIDVLARRYPEKCVFDRASLTRLFGADDVLDVIDGQREAEMVLKDWGRGTTEFGEKARRYWRY